MKAEQPPSHRVARWLRYRVVLYVVLGLVALDCCVARCRRMWHAYDPDEYRERIHEGRRHSWDLVVVGGSLVCEGVNPAVLTGVRWHGRPLERVYNLGLPGATSSEVWHAVRHGISQSPRVLVYGITASDVNEGRLEPHGPSVLMDAGDVAHWVRSRPDSAFWCMRQYVEGQVAGLWELYRYRNAVRLWVAEQVEQVHSGLCPEVAAEARDGLRMTRELRENYGYAPRPHFRDARFDQLKKAGCDFSRFPYLEKYRLGGHLLYLQRLIDWADNQGVDLVLVEMPVTPDLENLQPQPFATFRSALAELEKSRGVHVLRASRERVGLTDADFADLIHLNAAGAARLSAWLRDYLADISATVHGEWAAHQLRGGTR